MRTVTKEFKVYDFKELSEEIREDLIQKKIEQEQEFFDNYMLEDMAKEYAEILLEENFGKNVEFKNACYDLSYCQGSGAMIEYTITNIDKFLLENKIATETEIYNIENTSIKIVQDGNYNHERSFNIYQDIQINSECKDYEELDRKIYEFVDTFIHELVVSINETFYKHLLEICENSIMEDDVTEILEENLYLEDGTVFGSVD